MGHILNKLLDLCEDFAPDKQGKVIEGDFRPRVLLPGDGRLLDDFAGDLVKELRDKPIFNHGGLVMVIDPVTNKLRPIGQTAFRSWVENQNLGNVVCQGRVGSGKNAMMIDQTLSEEGSKGVLASHRFVSGLREIRRVNIVRLPVQRDNGHIELLPEGYDSESKIFTNKICDYDENLDIESAKKHLEAMLSDTAFSKNDYSRSLSATVAMMLAPFADSLFGQFTSRPSFIVQANQEGAGKSTLIKFALAPIFGPVLITPPPEKRNEGELTKLLNSIAQAGAPYLFLDNWIGKIESGALAAFITANAMSARVLGTSYMFDAPKHCMVFISANQANVAGEMRRRSIFIDLFVEEAKAEDRKIKNPIDEGDILDWRADILASLWAHVREWARAPARKPGTVRHASFDEWGRTIGGILEASGYVSPLLSPPLSVDERLESMMKIVQSASAQMLGNELVMKPSDLMELARAAGAFTWFLNEEKPDEDAADGRKEIRSERKSFSYHCDHFKGRTFTIGDKRINLDSIGDGHSKQWRFTHAPS